MHRWIEILFRRQVLKGEMSKTNLHLLSKLPMCDRSLSVQTDPLVAELDSQDRYLHHYHMQRVAILPDKNCLFSAVCKAGSLHMDWYDLRTATAGYIAGHMNDFHKFMTDRQDSTLLDNMADIAEELQMMKEGESWVGYETIMALSRLLGVVILVTSGGTSANDVIRTDSFYFGEVRPETRIHLAWVSLGFYDAVVATPDSADDKHLARRRPVKTDLLPRRGRRPSHCCDCAWSCDCRRWRETYTFPGETVQPSSAQHANVPKEIAQPSSPSQVNSSPAQPSSVDQKWKQVFKYLIKQSFVLQKWKFILRWLHVGEDKITAIARDNCPLDEKVFNGFESWRQGNKYSTIEALQDALLEEDLVLVAGTIAIFFVHITLCS